MAKINKGFLNLKENYLFIEIGKRVQEYQAKNPNKPLIRMGIGDVTCPLAPAVVEAMEKASAEMGKKETFKGYEDSGRGYDFLRNAVSEYYIKLGANISSEEVFISDGAKSDCGNITDIFSAENKVLVTDPVYPVYVDANIMGNREVLYVNSNESNGFAAMPDKTIKADIIYLCSPNNPTGSVYTKEQLKEWVDYALENEAVIIYDAAYEAFIRDETVPRTIYAVPEAKKCAVEIYSFSKTAGFTGTRCGYTVVPKELLFSEANQDNERYSIHRIWSRRQGSKFNGVSYPVQRAAEAVFSPEGQRQCKEIIDFYLENAKIMTETFDSLGINYTGGNNSPYIWFKCPFHMKSWEFFDFILNEIQVVGTPGAGFGGNGDGWFRLTAFGSRENTAEAMNRLKNLINRGK